MNAKFPIENMLRQALFADPDGQHPSQNLVDGLFAIADSLKGLTRALQALGNGDAATHMGAIEANSVVVEEGLREASGLIAEALRAVAGGR